MHSSNTKKMIFLYRKSGPIRVELDKVLGLSDRRVKSRYWRSAHSESLTIMAEAHVNRPIKPGSYLSIH